MFVGHGISYKTCNIQYILNLVDYFSIIYYIFMYNKNVLYIIYV